MRGTASYGFHHRLRENETKGEMKLRIHAFECHKDPEIQLILTLSDPCFIGAPR